MRPAAFCARIVALFTVGVTAGLTSCGGVTEPVIPSPRLASYYDVDEVDGQRLPAATVFTGIGGSPVAVSLVGAALTLDPLYTKWEMNLVGGVYNYGAVRMGLRAPTVIGHDSVEIYLGSAAVPVLVGRFTDTSLVLRPVGGTTRPAAPIDSLDAHEWRLRPSAPVS